MTTLISGGSLIQSSFPGTQTAHGNLEAVIGRVLGGDLLEIRHCWRDQSRPDLPWQLGAVITATAIGPAWITQRRDIDGRRGNFEVLVPERGGRDAGLAHYWLDNSAGGPRPWNRVQGWAVPGATSPGAVIENRLNGNLEAVALVGSRLLHYWFDRTAWRAAGTITEQASGPATLFQSSFGDHLEVIVPEGGDLVLYWLAGFGPDDYRWLPGGLITNAGSGPHGAVQGRYGVDPHRNFELLVPRDDIAAAYWRDNSRASLPWRPAGVATWGALPIAAASLCATTLGSGWLQALTQEGTSLYHLYRHDLPNGFRWMRSACLRLDDLAPADRGTEPRSRKLAQITGELDAQHGGPTLSSSETVSGIRGTDLGVSFQHAHRHFVLFGDTHWFDGSRVTLDSIAEVRAGLRGALPTLELHGSPLEIVGGPITQREYDVPLDAFSLAGQVFAFLMAR
jgi:hypothetical protein